MWAGLADFIDRSPTLVGKLALPFLLVGGGLQLAIHWGYVDPSAFDGVVGQTVPIIWVTGLSLAAVWLVATLIKLPEIFRGASASRRHAQQVRDNLRFLDETAGFLLLVIIKDQGGRCPGTGSQAFNKLTSLGIMELETDFTRGFSSHGVYRVSPFIRDTEGLADTLAAKVLRSSYIDVSSPEGRKRYMDTYPQSW